MEREIKIDILKSLGAILIILAHVCNLNILFQIRNFDVPLMVLISGYLSIKTFKREDGIIKYYKKRIMRLIVPTYIFFIIFFVVVKLFNWGQPYPFSIKTIVSTFLLLDGVGYVWIIRVYTLGAIMVPILIYLINKMKMKYAVIIISLLYCIYEISYFFLGDVNIIFKYVINYLIPYSMILYIGMEVYKSNNKKLNVLILLFTSIFIALMIFNYSKNGHFVGTQMMKYPPRLYYISYALMVSLFLFRILNNEKILKTINNNFIIFISKNSLWVYLWHILYVYILGKFSINYIVKFLLILLCTVTTVYIQQRIVKSLEKMKTLIKVS